jgi:hypothetical protein
MLKHQASVSAAVPLEHHGVNDVAWRIGEAVAHGFRPAPDDATSP